MTNDKQFYKNLKSFHDFSLLGGGHDFVPVPDSWSVLITDVKGSTVAIREGRYKEVNLIGAASITCVLNVLEMRDIPFVFGGDGATILIPTDLLPPVLQQLQGLQRLSQSDFHLELRVGHVTMPELRAKGTDLLIAKYELSPGNYTAQLKGGALNLAEEMIKKHNPPGAHLVTAIDNVGPPLLEGLSCRLKPLESRKGNILSLLVKPLGPQFDENLNQVLIEIRRILDGDFRSARPVSPKNLSWKWPPDSLRSEVATQKQGQPALIQWIVSGLRTLISGLMLVYNIPMGGFVPSVYKSELITNSDFKKYDETLRMVIDCSPEQTSAIETILQKLKDENKIFFGIHKSSSALMTCMVKSATANQHIHFIDGSDGGYAMAAAQLKAQLKQ